MNDRLQSECRVLVETDAKDVHVYSLKKLAEASGRDINRLPYSIRVLLENMLRNINGKTVTAEDVEKVLNWDAKATQRPEIPYMPARVVMQDFTGVPAVVDFAAMRDAFQQAGGDPKKVNPLVDAALVVDHSVQVDYYGTLNAMQKNIEKEYQRNGERYSLLKWAQGNLADFKVVPPGMGIIHQVNLEYLSRVVINKTRDGQAIAYPDTLIGTDSHTTMISGIGVLGWGVGGIEAEAVMLGQPYYMILPDVVGVKLTGELREGVTATDLVLRITQELRQQGVVGKFVEYFGAGLKHLTLPDRATIANMVPEYGATVGFFPVDKVTCEYLKLSNRAECVELAQPVLDELMLYRRNDDAEPEYTTVVEIDLASVDATLAGPKRPQDRVPLREMSASFQQSLTHTPEQGGFGVAADQTNKSIPIAGMDAELQQGSVVIAAITSCTNTSNPYVMVGAGLLAKNAVKKGLEVKPFVKTSLAPGSQVVTAYLEQAGLLPYLEKLRFDVVGYGCTTCIGNSGPLDQPIIDAIDKGKLVVASVLSGNRNFEGRINPYSKANYLASPMLVVAYALAGNVNMDLTQEPIGQDRHGNDVYLKDIWPTNREIHQVVDKNITPEMFADRYAKVYEGTDAWKSLGAPKGTLYGWNPKSTYIQNPPFFAGFDEHQVQKDILDARVLALLGDSVTTDHISPAGTIPADYPAGQYLQEQGVAVQDFNSYGSRRGNHEVMMRGTFANVRLRNLLVPGVEGGYTQFHPNDQRMFIYDAAMQYQQMGTPLVVIAGKEYGTGSSRDWAAKGTKLLGIKAVIAESYERIHRSNLVGMGVMPLQFMPGENAKTLGLDGKEVYTIRGLNHLQPHKEIEVSARNNAGDIIQFKAIARLDTEIDVEYYNNGGILQTVLLNMLG